LYIEFEKDKFTGIEFDKTQEPELARFINEIQNGIHKFDDYESDLLEYFAERIYELRKN
jgi:hypothetical protein